MSALERKLTQLVFPLSHRPQTLRRKKQQRQTPRIGRRDRRHHCTQIGAALINDLYFAAIDRVPV
jgi:hypothetical protein